MSDLIDIRSVRLGEDEWLDIADLARVCETTAEFIEVLIAEELIAPARPQPPAFGGAEIARVRRILRLQHDFEASLCAVAVLLDLIEENERLRTLLRRAGLETHR